MPVLRMWITHGWRSQFSKSWVLGGSTAARKVAEAERRAEALAEENASLVLQLNARPTTKAFGSLKRQLESLERQLAQSQAASADISLGMCIESADAYDGAMTAHVHAFLLSLLVKYADDSAPLRLYNWSLAQYRCGFLQSLHTLHWYRRSSMHSEIVPGAAGATTGRPKVYHCRSSRTKESLVQGRCVRGKTGRCIRRGWTLSRSWDRVCWRTSCSGRALRWAQPTRRPRPRARPSCSARWPPCPASSALSPTSARCCMHAYVAGHKYSQQCLAA